MLLNSKNNIEADNIAKDSDDSYASNKFTSLLVKIFKSKIAGFSFLGIFTLALFLFITPFFLNNAKLKIQIEEKVSQSLGINFKINGKVEVAILPYPSVTAHDVLLRNYFYKDRVYNLYAGSIKAKIAIFKFLGNNKIKDITFSDAALESYHNENQQIPRQNKLTGIITKSLENIAITQNKPSGISDKLFSANNFELSNLNKNNLPAIIIKNSDLSIYDIDNDQKSLTNINISAKIKGSQIKAEGQFDNEKITTKIKANLHAKGGESLLTLDSVIMHLQGKGNFSSKNGEIYGSNFDGKIEIEIFDLKSFYKSYIRNRGAIYEKLKLNNKPVKVTSDLTKSESEITFNNIIIKSLLINGKGNIIFDLNRTIPDIDVDLSLENIDLDNIWSGERVEIEEVRIRKKDQEINQKISDQAEIGNEMVKTLTKTTENPEGKVAPIALDTVKNLKNFDLTSEIKINKVSYLNGDITNVDLYLTVSKNGEILVMPLLFTLPGNGMLRASGILANDDGAPKFIGTFDVNGKKLQDVFHWLKIESQNLKFDNLKEYTAYSEVVLMPNSILLNNFYLNLNNDSSEFLGEIKIDNSGKTTNITNKFQVSNFVIDDYFLTSRQNIYLSPGSLLQKLLWLNEITSNNDWDLSFDNLTYKGEKFYNQLLKLKFGQGYIAIDNLTLKSDQTDLKTSLNIDIRDKNPKFAMIIFADKFHYESPQKQNQTTQLSAVDQFFILPSLEAFSGKIELDLKNVKFDDLEIANTTTAGTLKDGNVELSYFNCDLYGGKLDYKGLIGIKSDKTINGNLTFNNVQLDQLLSSLTGIKNIRGITNISANITSSANNKSDFIKEMDSEIKFNANTPIVVGYGLTDLIQKMFLPQNYKAELQQPEKILFNPNNITTLSKATGVISISKANGNRFKIDISAPALNGILTGKIDLSSNTIDGLANMIFLTGTKQKQTPINIATSFKGKMDGISQNTNLDQVRQYLKLEPLNKAKKTNSDMEKTAEEKADELLNEQKTSDNNIAPDTNSNQPNNQTTEKTATPKPFSAYDISHDKGLSQAGSQ